MIKLTELDALGFVLEEHIEDEYTTYKWTHSTKEIEIEITEELYLDLPKKQIIELSTGVNWVEINIPTTTSLKAFINILNS